MTAGLNILGDLQKHLGAGIVGWLKSVTRREVQVVNRREMTAVERRAFDKIQELDGHALETLRAMASQWRNVCVLANSVVIGISFVTGGQILPKLGSCTRTAVLALLAFAWLASFLSVVLSTRASFGWPKELRVTGPDDYFTWERREIRWTRRYFVSSLWLAAATLALYFVCLVLINANVQN